MRVTIDLMKKSTQIIDLSNVINPRVGDDGQLQTKKIEKERES